MKCKDITGALLTDSLSFVRPSHLRYMEQYSTNFDEQRKIYRCLYCAKF